MPAGHQRLRDRKSRLDVPGGPSPGDERERRRPVVAGPDPHATILTQARPSTDAMTPARSRPGAPPAPGP